MDDGLARTVVIVEDDVDQQELFATCLTRSGRYAIVGRGESAEQGVAQARAGQPDIVLLDLRLHQSTGQESIPDLLVVAPQAMIVAMSGYDDAHARGQALADGAFAFITKAPRLYRDDNLAALLDDLCVRFDAMLAGEETVAPIIIDAEADPIPITTQPLGMPTVSHPAPSPGRIRRP